MDLYLTKEDLNELLIVETYSKVSEKLRRFANKNRLNNQEYLILFHNIHGNHFLENNFFENI